jgi:hypothetical protein
MLQRHLDATHNRLDRVDLPWLATHASQADLDIFGQLPENRHISRAGRSELHGDVPHFEAA